MNENEIQNHFKQQITLTEELDNRRIAWKKHLLLLASTLFGVLISLHSKSGHEHHVRLCFAVAVILLALGILFLAVSLYSHVDGIARLKKNHSSEGLAALHEGRSTELVTANERKLFAFCEIAGYMCFLMCVVSLASYAVLLIFQVSS